MTNSINWFEIPVKNFNRAKAFYATLLGADIQEMPHIADTEGNKIALHSMK